MNRPFGLTTWLQAHPTVGRDVDIRIVGRFDRRRVHTHWVARAPDTTPRDESRLEAAWQKRLAEALRAGRELYPGPLCRLERAEARGDDLWIELSPTDYREFVGTNLAVGDGDLSPDNRGRLADPLGVSVALTTLDGRLPLFRRSRRVAELPGMLHVVGGNVEPSDRRSEDHVDLFLAAEREVEEEAGIRASEIEGLACLGLARVRRTNKPEIVFAAKARLDSPELVVRFARRPSREHDEMVLIEATPAAVLSFLASHAEEVVPAAKAALAIWTFGPPMSAMA